MLSHLYASDAAQLQPSRHRHAQAAACCPCMALRAGLGLLLCLWRPMCGKEHAVSA